MLHGLAFWLRLGHTWDQLSVNDHVSLPNVIASRRTRLLDHVRQIDSIVMHVVANQARLDDGVGHSFFHNLVNRYIMRFLNEVFGVD